MAELVETSKGNIVEKKRFRKIMKYGSDKHVQKLLEYIDGNNRDTREIIIDINHKIDGLKRTLANLKKDYDKFECIKKTQIAVHKMTHSECDGSGKKLDEILNPINVVMTHKYIEIEKVQYEIVTLEKQITTVKEIGLLLQKQKIELQEWEISKKLIIDKTI